jgi:hypothetical protein
MDKLQDRALVASRDFADDLEEATSYPIQKEAPNGLLHNLVDRGSKELYLLVSGGHIPSRSATGPQNEPKSSKLENLPTSLLVQGFVEHIIQKGIPKKKTIILIRYG